MRQIKFSLSYQLICLLTLLWNSHAFGERLLSEKELLLRCYAHLTGTRLSLRDPLWAQLKTTTAVTLCNNLMDSVQIGNDGVLTQRDNIVHRRVLKQFNDLHKNWFPQHLSYSTSFPDTYYGTLDVFDADEPALFYTQSLFAQTPVRSVLAGSQSLMAVRDSTTPKPNARGNTGKLRATRIIIGDVEPTGQQPVGVVDADAVAGQTIDGQYFQIPVSLLQVGELIGVKAHTDTSSTSSLWINNFMINANGADPTVQRPQVFHRGFGGGAVGSTPFVLLNFGHGFDFTANGTLKMPRRVVFTAMNSFLCQEGPFLRASDVTGYLAAETETEAASFRRGTSCLRCHATMDPAASTMRNLRLGSSINNIQAGTTRATAMVLNTNIDQPATGEWTMTPDPQFYRRPPAGRLLFRSVSGALVNQPLDGLESLGRTMAETDDYYACAASRYFKYFTGINVTLLDPGESSNHDLLSNMTEKDREYRNYVLELGRKLRETQSLKALAKQIMQSQYYKLSQFGR